MNGTTPINATNLNNIETGISSIVSRDEDIEAHGASTAASDNAGALQDALDAAETGGGRAVSPRVGAFYKINSTIFVPNKTVLVGAGRSDGGIQAGASFPTTVSPLIRLGRAADSLVFGCRVESMTVDCDGRAITGVYSTAANEQSGVRDVVVTNFTLHGIHFNPGSIFSVEDAEVYPQAGGATNGIYLQSSGGDNIIKRVTIGVAGLLASGIKVLSTNAVIVGAHFENCTNGIDLDNNAAAGIMGVTGPSVAANVTNLVRNRGNTRYAAAMNIQKNSATNAVLDEFFGNTLTDAYIPLWVGGDAQIARLRHIGDQVGFYNATPVAKPTLTGSRGGNAAVASIATALATLGLATDSTS